MELSLINVLMIFGIKGKSIILTNTINLLGLARFVDFIRLIYFYFFILNFILLTSTNWKNTGSGAFHGRESIKLIIRLFCKAA